jgi:hypothetical protein
MTAGLSLFVWCALRQIPPSLSAPLVILITLLLYRVAWSNYYMVFLCLVAYWTVSEWCWLRKKIAWTALLILYFTFLAVADFSYIRHIAYSGQVINLLQFLLGCTVMAGLIWLSILSASQHGSSNQLRRGTVQS